MDENDLINALAKEHMVRASGLLALLMPPNSGIAFAIKGLEGRYQLVNKAMETLLGKNRNTWSGASILSTVCASNTC